MKYILLLLILLSCADDKTNSSNISLDSCAELARLLNGSFAYAGTTDDPCKVYANDSIYYFYNEDELRGVKLGLNIPILKKIRECQKAGEPFTDENQALTHYSKCNTDLGYVY